MNAGPRIADYHLLDKTQFAIGDFGFQRIFNDARIFYLHRPIQPGFILRKIQTDYLIVSNNSCSNMSDLLDFFDFKELIVDSSNDYKTSKKLQRDAQKFDVKISLVTNGVVEL